MDPFIINRVKRLLTMFRVAGEVLTHLPNRVNVLTCRVLKSKKGDYLAIIHFEYEEINWKKLRRLQKYTPDLKDWNFKKPQVASDEEVLRLTGFAPTFLPAIAVLGIGIQVLLTDQLVTIPIVLCPAGLPDHWIKFPAKIFFRDKNRFVDICDSKLTEQDQQAIRALNKKLGEEIIKLDSLFFSQTRNYFSQQREFLDRETNRELFQILEETTVTMTKIIITRLSDVIKMMQDDPQKNTWQFLKEEFDAIVQRVEAVLDKFRSKFYNFMS